MVADDEGVTCSLWALHISAVVEADRNVAGRAAA